MKFKLTLSFVLAFLVMVFVSQNTDVVRVDFLAWSVDVSLVVLVFIMLGAGIVIGWLSNSYLRYMTRRKRNVNEIKKHEGESLTDEQQG